MEKVRKGKPKPKPKPKPPKESFVTDWNRPYTKPPTEERPCSECGHIEERFLIDKEFIIKGQGAMNTDRIIRKIGIQNMLSISSRMTPWQKIKDHWLYRKVFAIMKGYVWRYV